MRGIFELHFPSSEDQAMQELKNLLQNRLAAAERGEVSVLSADEVTEEVIREAGAS